ncbi:MAG: LLM class flavin-dependent oxidoreductase [Actinomycetota bacterium]
MHLGIGLPNALAPAVNRGLLLDWAKVSDQLGFHTFGTVDHPAYEGFDPIVALAAAAAVTERVRLATTVLQLPPRNELQVATQIAAVDRLSGGRVDLGVALGGRESDYAALGTKMKNRGRKIERQIRKIKRAWRAAKKATEEQPSVSGPAPIQKPMPPIWVGGSVEASLERAIKLGDGYIFGAGGGPQQIKPRIEKLRQMVTDAKKRRFQIVGLKYVAAGDAQALDDATRLTERYYGGPLWAPAEEVFLHGGGEEILASCKEYEEAGLDLLILMPQVPDIRQVEVLGSEVLPAFRIPGR